MNNDDLTCVNVAGNALVEFIERIAVAGSTDIKVSQGDNGWYVTYRPPFTRGIKTPEELEEDTSKEITRKSICTFKHKISSGLLEPVDCYEVYDCNNCKAFKAPCSSQEKG